MAYLLGRAAAAATAATVFGSYVLPDRPLAAAVGVVVVVTGLAVAGVTWTVAQRVGAGRRGRDRAARGRARRAGRRGRRPAASCLRATATRVPVGPASAGAPGVLTAAGLLFFAYVGFARLFPLGAQLRDPRGCSAGSSG